MSNLPPLPESEGYVHYPARAYEPEWTSSAEAYTADQMRAYAEEAVRLEREAAASEVESWRGGKLLLNAGEMTAQEMRTVRAVTGGIAAAIRSRSREGQG